HAYSPFLPAVKSSQPQILFVHKAITFNWSKRFSGAKIRNTFRFAMVYSKLLRKMADQLTGNGQAVEGEET
ncbi:MAG: hypothetical protein RR999_05855, partial [Bacteroides sp.]